MSGNTPQESTVLAFSPAGRALVLGGPALLGVAVAVAAPIVSRQLVDIGFPVLGVVWRVAASVDTWWKVTVQAAILAVLGAVASAEIVRRSTRVTIGRALVRLETGDRVVSVNRTDVDFVFTDGSVLVILDHESRELFRGEPQAGRAELERGFREFGYPWRDGDPFTDLYRPWEPGSGRLPLEADAVLSARAVALRKKAGREATELREILEKLGYAIRDEGDRQLWRPLVRS